MVIACLCPAVDLTYMCPAGERVLRAAAILSCIVSEVHCSLITSSMHKTENSPPVLQTTCHQIHVLSQAPEWRAFLCLLSIWCPWAPCGFDHIPVLFA